MLSTVCLQNPKDDHLLNFFSTNRGSIIKTVFKPANLDMNKNSLIFRM